MTENQNTEYKLILTDKFERAAVSFLNSKMGGVLYIGIDDDGKFNILAYLFADQNGTVNANGGINGGINFEDKENKIISYLKNNPSALTDEISLQTDIPVRTVQRIIKSLKEEGII